MKQQELFGKNPLTTAQKILAGKWPIVILGQLHQRSMDFVQLQQALPDLTQMTIAKHLRNLEEYGLIQSQTDPSDPDQAIYSLTEIGKDFGKVLRSLEDWGQEYITQMKNSHFTPQPEGV